jgi:hypothetical protein
MSLTLGNFLASRRWSDDLAEAGCCYREDGEPTPKGYVYLDLLYIEQAGEKWHLTLHNREWITHDLPALEVRLYEWAVAEGYVSEPAMYRCEMVTAFFNFEAYGASEAEAWSALKAGLAKHGQQYRLRENWWDGGFDHSTYAIAVGASYRDRELLGAAPEGRSSDGCAQVVAEGVQSPEA